MFRFDASKGVGGVISASIEPPAWQVFKGLFLATLGDALEVLVLREGREDRIFENLITIRPASSNCLFDVFDGKCIVFCESPLLRGQVMHRRRQFLVDGCDDRLDEFGRFLVFGFLDELLELFRLFVAIKNGR